MGINKPSDRIIRISDKLMEQAAAVHRSQLKSFGYRERIAIERLLFLIIKDICLIRLQYRLQGLTEVHRLALLHFVKNRDVSSELNRFITRVFELRVFLYSLSSVNPYVQGDAISRVGMTKRSVVNFTAKELRKMAALAMELGVEQAAAQ